MIHERTGLILQETIRHLKKTRLEKELSHDALATLARVSRPAVSHIENGRRKPTLLMALKIAHGLGVDLSTILHTAEKANPK